MLRGRLTDLPPPAVGVQRFLTSRRVINRSGRLCLLGMLHISGVNGPLSQLWIYEGAAKPDPPRPPLQTLGVTNGKLKVAEAPIGDLVLG